MRFALFVFTLKKENPLGAILGGFSSFGGMVIHRSCEMCSTALEMRLFQFCASLIRLVDLL